jgi:DNA-binding Lrp family transcriptional regulator
MDLKLLKLLYYIDYDARISLSSLSKKLQLSKQNINYKIKKLEEEKIIEKYVSVIDIHKLGFLTYRAYIRLGRVTGEDLDKISMYLKDKSYVLWLVSISGAWDFEIVFVARNYVEFSKQFQEIKEYLKEKLVKHNMSLSISNLHYKRDYLLEKGREIGSIAYYGYEPQNRKVDETDLKILIELSENCRNSYQEIGKRIKVSNHTVKARIKRMEKEEIIKAYRTKINIQKLGYKHMKAGLYLYPHTEKIESELITYISSFQNVTYVVKILGEWEIEIEAEVKDQEQFFEILRSTRNKYPNLINDYNTFEVKREIKLNYFPNAEKILKKIKSQSK